MHWKTKARIQRALQYIPFGEALHYQLQRRAGGLKDVSAECRSKIEDWSIMMEHLSDAGVNVAESNFLEIGTGWYPTFPFCLYIAGAKSVNTYDLNPHLKLDLVSQCVETLDANIEKILKHCVDHQASRARFERLKKSFAVNRDISLASEDVISYSAPADATATQLENNSVDIVFSNSVLEHVPGDIIKNMMEEAFRILRPDGLMFHSVNCGDHYAYIDSSVNQLHYLQFSDSEWESWNTSFLYQNRIRGPEFTKMATFAGFKIVLDTSNPLDERLKQLSEMDVAKEFSQYSKEELCLTTIDFIGKKPA